MSSKKEKLSWADFKKAWSEKAIIVSVDPYKAMKAWKDGLIHTWAQAVWSLGALCVPAGCLLGFFYGWWWVLAGPPAFLALHLWSQHLRSSALTRAILEDERLYRIAVDSGWVRISRLRS